MSDSIFVGIDVSTKSNKVCILDASGNRLANMSVHNNSHGSSQIVNRVIDLLCKTGCTKVSFGLEATSVYGDGLIFYLKQDKLLKNYATKVFLLNPKQVHNLKRPIVSFLKLMMWMPGLCRLLTLWPHQSS